jgi:flagellar hook-associated protein 3 FlgL
MRVTYNNLIDSVLNGFQNNASTLQRLQEKLATGKNIASPDQGPTESAKILAFRTRESQYDQYVSNIDESLSWLTFSENTVSQISENLARVRELAVSSVNGSLPSSAREAAILELQQIKSKLISDGNSQILNKYIFSGLNTLTKPFAEVAGAVTYYGDDNEMEREISFNSGMSINTRGDKLFNMGEAATPGDPNVFEIIDNFITQLQTEDYTGISNTTLGQLDNATDNITNLYSEIGSRVNMLELTKEQHNNNLLEVKSMLSNIEDIDLAQIVIDLKKADQIYQTSLSVAGQVFPQTLLDYLQ